MNRVFRLAAQASALAVSLGSCTCTQESPPSGLPTRAPGFQASAPTTSLSPTPGAPTPTAAPTQQPASATPAADLAVPADFPPDVPIFKGASLAAVQKLGGGAHNVLFSVAAKPEEIFAFYKDDLKQKGFEVTQQYQASEQSFLSFKKGQLVTNVVIAPDPRDPAKRIVGIMYQVEEEIEEF